MPARDVSWGAHQWFAVLYLLDWKANAKKSMTTSIQHCLIIGAGMSGLMAAHQLQSHGVNVTLLDKGRGVGGRLATRWAETPGGAKGYFDHGAQFFTVREARFQALVDEWLAAGLVREWSKGFPQTIDDTNDDGHPRYCGAAGMNAIARHLAQGLDVRLNAQVERLACDERQWHAQLTNGETFIADALILTPPVPQSLALLAAFTPHWPASTLQALTDITYDPCFAVLAVLAAPSHLRPRRIANAAGPLPETDNLDCRQSTQRHLACNPYGNDSRRA
ncbi:MAG: FAD-dependent oxidoreductase [Acidobacteria bacterium]|nr:FAD-dependent oxidoreductase [Acidobacteriota bacterium]